MVRKSELSDIRDAPCVPCPALEVWKAQTAWEEVAFSRKLRRARGTFPFFPLQPLMPFSTIIDMYGSFFGGRTPPTSITNMSMKPHLDMSAEWLVTSFIPIISPVS